MQTAKNKRQSDVAQRKYNAYDRLLDDMRFLGIKIFGWSFPSVKDNITTNNETKIIDYDDSEQLLQLEMLKGKDVSEVESTKDAEP